MIQTDDLYLAALGLVRGGELLGVFVRGANGRRVAVFRIAGEAMAQAERDYHRGVATVDLRLLKSEVRRLKDVAFQAIREEEKSAGQQRGDRAPQGGERACGRHR